MPDWKKVGSTYKPDDLLTRLKPGVDISLEYNPYSKKYQAFLCDETSEVVSEPASLATTKRRALRILEKRGFMPDADYEDIVCFACGSAVELPQDESDKIIKAAYKAEGY